MSKERLHTTLNTETLEYLAVLKVRKKLKGINGAIEYLVKKHKEIEDNEYDNRKTK